MYLGTYIKLISYNSACDVRCCPLFLKSTKAFSVPRLSWTSPILSIQKFHSPQINITGLTACQCPSFGSPPVDTNCRHKHPHRYHKCLRNHKLSHLFPCIVVAVVATMRVSARFDDLDLRLPNNSCGCSMIVACADLVSRARMIKSLSTNE